MASAIGLTFVVATVAGLAAVADSPFALFPAVLGAGLLVAALDANDVAAAATPFEVILLCCLGIAFAVVFDVPALAVALPLFLGAIDVVQALGGRLGRAASRCRPPSRATRSRSSSPTGARGSRRPG